MCCMLVQGEQDEEGQQGGVTVEDMPEVAEQERVVCVWRKALVDSPHQLRFYDEQFERCAR